MMSSRMQAHFLLTHPRYLFNYFPKQDHMSIQASRCQGATILSQLFYTESDFDPQPGCIGMEDMQPRESATGMALSEAKQAMESLLYN